MDDLLPEILKAERRIRPYTLTTPLLHSLTLSTEGTDVYLKLESEQYTGSFKARGSMNKVLSLSDSERSHGVVTASTGNHGLGLARAAKEADVPCVVFVPENADTSKVEAIKQYGATVKHTTAGAPETISHGQAKQYAAEHGMTWVSPYNDLEVIAGQGTIAIELMQQLASVDYVFVTVGAGGLASGIAAYLSAVSPETKIVGCLPERSAEMYHSVKAGKFVHMQSLPTLSDGSGGGFEEGSITFPLCQKFIKDWTLVSEGEIKDSMRLIVTAHHKFIEGSAGVAVASYLRRRGELTGKKVVIILCGSNVAASTLKEIL
ncbi:MAG TPA: threonine/serine dehydratase [Verrucomicrobiae bacterium]|nr:threonine/serine dehydratase [Verrucomicrobiae bacterium]